MADITYSKAKGLLGSAAWNIALLLFGALSGFITMPIIIRNIGTANFGLYSIIMVVGGFVALQDLGLGEATLRFVTKYYWSNDLEGINRILGATLSIYIITSTFCCFIIILFAVQIISLLKMESAQVHDAILSLRIASVGFGFVTIAAALQKIPEAMQRYDISCKVGLVLTIIRCILIIIVVKVDYGIVGLASLLTLNALLMLIIYGIISRLLISGLSLWPHFKISGIKEVLSYGIFSFINQLIASISTSLDRIILGMFFGVADVAFLSAPKGLLSQASSLTGAAGQALFPRFSRMDNKHEITQLYINSTWTLFCFSLILFIPIMILLPEFLALWISPDFSKHSARVAQYFAIYFSVLGVTVPLFSYLKGTGKIHWLTLIFFISSGLSIVLGIILIKLFGLQGAGIRAFCMCWSAIIIAAIVLKKGVGSQNFLYDISRCIILPLIVSTVFACTSFYLWSILDFHGWLSLFLGFPIMGGLLAVILVGADLFLYKKKGASILLLNKLKHFVCSGWRN